MFYCFLNFNFTPLSSISFRVNTSRGSLFFSTSFFTTIATATIPSQLIVAIVARSSSSVSSISGSPISVLTSETVSAFTFVNVKLNSKNYVFCDTNDNKDYGPLFTDGLIISNLNSSQSQIQLELLSNPNSPKDYECIINEVKLFSQSWQLIPSANETIFRMESCFVVEYDVLRLTNVHYATLYVVYNNNKNNNNNNNNNNNSTNVLFIVSKPPSPTPPSPSSSSSSSLVAAVAVMSVLFLMLLVILCVLICCWWCRR